MIDAVGIIQIKNILPVGTSVVGIFKRKEYTYLLEETDELLLMQERYDFLSMILPTRVSDWNVYIEEFLQKNNSWDIDYFMAFGDAEVIRFSQVLSSRLCHVPIVFCPKGDGLLQLLFTYQYTYHEMKRKYLGYRVLSKEDKLVYPFFSCKKQDFNYIIMQMIWICISQLREGRGIADSFEDIIVKIIDEMHGMLQQKEIGENNTITVSESFYLIEKELFECCKNNVLAKDFMLVQMISLFSQIYGFPMDQLFLQFLPEYMKNESENRRLEREFFCRITKRAWKEWKKIAYGKMYEMKNGLCCGLKVPKEDLEKISHMILLMTEYSEEECYVAKKCIMQLI